MTDDRTDSSRGLRSRLTRWFDSLDRVELVATVVLALAAIATAWSAFQSSKWSGDQAILFSEASAARTESARASATAGQLTQIDVGVFVDWLAALDTDVRSGAVEIAAGQPYQPDPDTLSGFLFSRFREEFRPAVQAWLDTAPLTDPNAPKTPFEMPEYTLEAAMQADALLVEAEEKAAGARRANQNSDNYVLTGVLFALVLFFAGVSSKLKRRRNLSIMMGLAVLGLVTGIVTVLLLPIHALF